MLGKTKKGKMNTNEIRMQAIDQLQDSDPEYVRLVTRISDLWEDAKNRVADNGGFIHVTHTPSIPHLRCSHTSGCL